MCPPVVYAHRMNWGVVFIAEGTVVARWCVLSKSSSISAATIDGTTAVPQSTCSSNSDIDRLFDRPSTRSTSQASSLGRWGPSSCIVA